MLRRRWPSPTYTSGSHTLQLQRSECDSNTQLAYPSYACLCACVQLAPYSTQYERLSAHLDSAGVAVEPNLWDQPVSLAREHRHMAPDSPKGLDGRGEGSSAPVGPRMSAQLLPPHKLLPFMVPFRGGPGSLCGGAASLSSK